MMQKSTDYNSNTIVIGMLIVILFCFSTPLSANTQCAKVKIEIKQEITIERQAFDARLKITNGSPVPLTGFRVRVDFVDDAGNWVWATSDPNDMGAYFFIRPDSNGISVGEEPDEWVLPDLPAAAPGEDPPFFEVHWLIIPAPGAAGEDPRGTRYQVSAEIDYQQGEEAVNVTTASDTITVMPMPELTLDYFLPTYIFGDDPMTPTVIEPVEPFPLALLVRNIGYGDARGMKIESSQPKIVENFQNLPISFKITGSNVNGQSASKSLLVELGNLAPGKSTFAEWTMECSLTGEFVSFEAKISHADELGGQVTSLIPQDNVQTHSLVKLVRIPATDGVIGVLSTDRHAGYDPRRWWLELFDTRGLTNAPVDNQSDDATFTAIDPDVYQLEKNPYDQDPGYIFLAVPDPFAGAYPLQRVVRSDGEVLDVHNAWLSRTREDNQDHHWLNVFDANTYGITYTVYFDTEGQENRPPVLQTINDWTVRLGTTLGFRVYASDPEGAIPVIYTSPLPFGAGFTDEHNGQGVFRWQPAPGQLGDYKILFMASDGELTTEQLVTIHVVGENYNRPPVVGTSSLATDEDTAVSGTLPGHDPDRDPVTFHIVTPPAKGTLNLTDPATGEFTFTPYKNVTGSDRILFALDDGREQSGQGEVTIQIRPVNDSPATAAARITVMAGHTSAPVEPEVSDPDDQSFTFTIETAPLHGTAAVAGNRLVYTAAPDYVGEDPFTFRAADTGGLYIIGECTVTVTEPEYDIVLTGALLAGDLLQVQIGSEDPAPLEDVRVDLLVRACDGETPLLDQLVDLQPGSNLVEFDLTGLLTPGLMLSAVVNADGQAAETDPWNNRYSLVVPGGETPPLATDLAWPSVFPRSQGTTLTGRTWYRLLDAEGPLCHLPVQGQPVRGTLTEDKEEDPEQVWQGQTVIGRNGAWHLPVAWPAETGSYILRISIGDAPAADVIEKKVTVAGSSPSVPYPGPAGFGQTVEFDDGLAANPWLVKPGTPVPTAGPGGSGVRGGATGSGHSADLMTGGPVLGASGGAAALFDAEVPLAGLQFDPPVPDAGQSVILTGTVQANDSYYGLPVGWRITNPRGETRELIPACWYYLNGELKVRTAYTPPAEGTYGVALWLGPGFSDGQAANNLAVQALVVRPPNRPPVLDTWQIPDHAWTGDPVALNATATDPDGDPLTFRWDFGDGQNASGDTGATNHIYQTADRFTVRITVEDGRGGSDFREVEILVEQRPNHDPVIQELSIPAQGVAGSMVSFSATATDEDLDALTYDWNFGDGGTGSGSSVSHAYGAAGSYTVTVTVSDGRGGQDGDQGSINISPFNRPPEITSFIIPALTVPGKSEWFRAAAVDDDGDSVVYYWNFGDGQAGAGKDVQHAYAGGGRYTVTLTVEDGKGGSDTSSGDVLVNTPPVIGAIGKQTVYRDQPVGPVPFTVSDGEHAALDLAVTALSSNQSLVPDSSITLGGSGTNRFFSCQPVAGQSGMTVITITCSDGLLAGSRTFEVWVTRTFIWVDDALPAGAVPAASGGDGWDWVTSGPPPFSGEKSHRSADQPGFHQHSFTGATVPLPAGADSLFTVWVYLDAGRPARQILLQWHDGTWEHRAWWGEDLLSLADPDSPAYLFMGPLPPAGRWVQLTVPAESLGLAGDSVDGMSFGLYDGQAAWDAAGIMDRASGDLNNDGVCDAKDLTVLGRYLAGNAPALNASLVAAADLDDDGDVDSADLMNLLIHLVK